MVKMAESRWGKYSPHCSEMQHADLLGHGWVEFFTNDGTEAWEDAKKKCFIKYKHIINRPV